ncbi:MAG: class I SAM-dependent methyltransferase [Candidatus Hydrogenedentes bacterium]|nr:class I SAM-dependent methyltransferase [Candidatus Hydrogenedentota bacterium]
MKQQDLRYVPGRVHYSIDYVKGGRIFSYAHQIDSVISFEPVTVLEIGAGGGVVTSALRALGLGVTTLDVQTELRADITASVTEIPCSDKSFDVTLCSQVLEHLPFEQFAPALSELRRVSKRGLVLSLPDASRHWYIAGRLPKLPEFKIPFQLRRWAPVPDHALEGAGHYWEIGYSEYPLTRILREIREVGWRLDSTWRVTEMSWHRFFRLENS